MPADPLRERLKALVEEWSNYKVTTHLDRYAYGRHEGFNRCADQLSALLAESEPEPPRPDYSWFRGEVNEPLLRKLFELGALGKPEPAPLRLGHKFVPCDDADACLHGYVDDTELGCGQPREAHLGPR